MSDNKNDDSLIGALVLGSVAVGAILYSVFKPKKPRKKKSSNVKKRVFISFAKEDQGYRDHLVNQAKNKRSPFEFIDMSVKSPWPENIWKDRCRTKIKGCDGLIVLLSGKTWKASGARWEVKCAIEEQVPVVGMHIFKNNQKSIPPELQKSKVITWKWKNLEMVIADF